MRGAHYEDPSVRLFHGNCVEVLAEIEEGSVDAVVTDPPYGLEFMGAAWDSFGRDTGSGYRESPRMNDAEGFGGYKERPNTAGRPFGAWCETWAAECLRVLRPGGHLLAFGGSRTWHRLASAVEDVGFELRDSIAWLYGSGFPKSMNVSKAIDKADPGRLDRMRPLCRWLRAAIEAHPTLSLQAIADSFGFDKRMAEHWTARDTDSQPAVPTPEQWEILRSLLGCEDPSIDQLVADLNDVKGEFGEGWKAREITGTVDEWTDRTNYALTSADGLRRDLPATDDAAAWEGWGTALKPAFEPIVVGRKPLAGTVAANVLEHGTGAINVDACRVGAEVRYNPAAGNKPGGASLQMSAVGMPQDVEGREVAGRWPTNVLLDDSQAAELDRQTGMLISGKMRPTHTSADRLVYGQNAAGGYTTMETYGDARGASRFFPTFRYEAKAPQVERPRDGEVAHPTVKPLDLMRWLVRLVTPPGGTVLEPFAGSGTTAEACVIEGFQCIAIEKHEPYLPLIVARLSKPIPLDLFGAAS